MNREDFQTLAAVRLKEAKLLLRAGCPEGAYYLAGYAAECALKACIAKQTKQHDFPDWKRVKDSYSHDLKSLLTLTGLADEFAEARKTDADLNNNWAIVTEWREDSRYDRRTSEDSEQLLRALDHDHHGVMQWLQHRW